MKIAISGTHGTGKTTLVNALKEIDFFKDYCFITNITRNLKKEGFDINENGTEKTQLKILETHLCNLKKEGDFILDRCLLDGLVYTHYLYLEGSVSKEILDKFEKKFKYEFYNYDLICYLEPEFDLEDDKIRSVNVKFRNMVQFLFNYYIEKYNLKVLKLTGSVEERINQILNETKFFNLRIDCHIHLGEIYKGHKSSTSKNFFVSPEQVAEFINFHKLTDAVILYSDYKYIDKLSTLTKCRLYGLQYIRSVDENLDINKPLFKGLKLHNYRSIVPIEYTPECLDSIFKQLDNHIVLYHTQQAMDCVEKIHKLVIKYPNIKHIIGHSGGYGLMTYKPKDISRLDTTKKYIKSQNSFLYASLLTNLYKNSFCDSSLVTPEKANFLKDLERFGCGSDFNLGSEASYNYKTQLKTLISKTGVLNHFIQKNTFNFLNY